MSLILYKLKILYLCMQMRRITAISLAVFYLVSIVGLDVQVHFCSGKIADINLITSDAASCCSSSDSKGCSSENKTKNCCEDARFVFSPKTSDFTVNNTDQVVKVLIVPEKISFEFPEYTTASTDDVPELIGEDSFRYRQPLWLLYSNFTFYG